jgi:hypothetical protein
MAAAPAAAAAGDDAELLRLVARFEAAEAKFVALNDLDNERERRGDWSADPRIAEVVGDLRRLRQAIGEVKATTRAGLRAKLRGALLDLGEDEPDACQHYRIGWSLCRDLAALGDGVLP